MTEKDFQRCLDSHAPIIEQMRHAAHQLHADVNQHYDGTHPYGFHLDMVADGVRRYGAEVCATEHDVLPLLFGAYYHDSIEDARQTYNDVLATARRYMDDAQARMAAEIAYALTNDKGRTRAERAGENYYRGIRQTPYAPLVKLADRLANTTYSFTHTNAANAHMKDVYRQEMPHFLEAISTQADDPRLALPRRMTDAIRQLVGLTEHDD